MGANGIDLTTTILQTLNADAVRWDTAASQPPDGYSAADCYAAFTRAAGRSSNYAATLASLLAWLNDTHGADIARQAARIIDELVRDGYSRPDGYREMNIINPADQQS